MPVYREHHCMPAGDEGKAMVHCWLLSGAGRRHNDSGREGGDGRAAEGGGVDFTGDFNVYLNKTVGRGQDKDIVAAVAAVGLEDLVG